MLSARSEAENENMLGIPVPRGFGYRMGDRFDEALFGHLPFYLNAVLFLTSCSLTNFLGHSQLHRGHFGYSLECIPCSLKNV